MEPIKPDKVREIEDIYSIANYTLGLSREDLRIEEKHVIHLTAVKNSEGDNTVIKINGHHPKSSYDSFLLSLSRSIVDGIITTGQILREEPELTHDPFIAKEALERFRKETLGKDNPPYTLIITSGRGLEYNHPIFKHGTVIIYTSDNAQIEEPPKDQNLDIRIKRSPNPSIRGAIDLLVEEFGANGISIEAGPRTNANLYEIPIGIDDLWLSRFHEKLDERAIGSPFPIRL